MSDHTDNKEIATIQPDPFLEMMERVASNPDIDADKMQKILDMQLQVMDRTARDEFYAAMTQTQANLPVVVKDAYNTQTSSQYAKIEAIAKAIKPIYTKEGFSMSFSQGKSDFQDHIRINGTLRHSSGHSEDHYHIDLPLDDSGIQGKKNKTPVHATGSTFTYGRRYLTCAMFNVTTEDDTDGNLPTNKPPPAKLISDKQASQIQDMLTVLNDANAPNSDEETFCAWAKIDSIRAMPSHKFARCLKNLKEKVEKINA